MTKKLTLKQKTFAHEYLRNGGNGTQAAAEVYDCTYESARAIASQNLARLHIREHIDQLVADSDGLTLDDALESLSQCLHAPMKPTISAGEKLAAITLLLKLHKAIPGTQPAPTSTATNRGITAKSIADRVAAQEIDITPETPQLNPKSD